MPSCKYDKYFENFEINKDTINGVLTALRHKDISWPFGVTKKFQEKMGEFLGTKYSIAHCNGTSAMYAAMFAVGVSKGSEVICPTYTFWASIAPAINLGAKVVFCDINKCDLLINVDSIKKYITARTRAIVVPHLWGRFCDINKLKKVCNSYSYKIYIIEDASHCFGAKYKDKYLGTLGDVGIFSLQAGKPLIAGEGGMLVTNSFNIYDAAIYLGHYERIKFLSKTKYRRYLKTGGGYKFRIHPLASALALAQLKGVKKRLQLHNKLMFYYESKLKNLPKIEILEKKYKKFTYGGRFGLRVILKINQDKKLNFIKECNDRGLKIQDEYIPLLHKEDFFKDHKARGINAKMSKKISCLHESLIALPIFYKGSKSIIDDYVEDLHNILKTLKD